MVQDPTLVMITKKADLAKVGGSTKLFFWYSVLKDYRKRFKRDKHGFTRVSSQVFSDDYGFDRKKVWRYNKELEDKGLVEIDRVHRGGRTWIGFRIV